MPNANLQSTAPLRKKTFYGEAMKMSNKASKKSKKSYYGKAMKNTGGSNSAY